MNLIIVKGDKMKHFVWLFLLAAMPLHPQSSIIPVYTAPSGSCAGGSPNQQVYSTGVIYSCQSGTWGSSAAAGVNGIPIAPSSVNLVGNPASYAGATADVQINACLAVYRVCDARSYGATTQTIAAPVVVGAYPSKTLILDPATSFAPATSSPPASMFSVNGYGRLIDAHVILPASPTYSGKVIDVEDSSNINSESPLLIKNVNIDAHLQGTPGGTCLYMAPPLNGFIQLVNAVDGLTCTGMAQGLSLYAHGNSSGLGYINGVNFSNMVLNAVTDIVVNPATAAYSSIDGNTFVNVQLEGTGLELDMIGAGGFQGNAFTNISFWDSSTPVANTNTTCSPVGNTGACTNTFKGTFGTQVTTAMDSLSAQSAYPYQNKYSSQVVNTSDNFQVVNVGGVSSPLVNLHTTASGSYAGPYFEGISPYNYLGTLTGFAGFVDTSAATLTPAYQIQIDATLVPVLTIDHLGTLGIGNSTLDPATGLISADPFTVTQAGIVKAAGGSANHAICWKPDGKTLGYCSAVVASDGTCGTCN